MLFVVTVHLGHMFLILQLTGVSWGNMDILVVVNKYSRLPGPYNNGGPAQPMKEGKDIINYMVGVQRIAICMDNGIQCLNITFQV